MGILWAKKVINFLVQNGVDHFFLSPGSRSTPLAYAIATHSSSDKRRAKAFVHFDERGSAYQAFGYAKGSKKVAALVCTSGSAVGNFFPAIMEALHDRIPLLVLTADRPVELHDCGENQSCDQVKIFGNYVKWSFSFPASISSSHDSFLYSTLAYALSQASHTPQGPVHLNCSFQEPFFRLEEEKDLGATLSFPTYEIGAPILSSSSLQRWGEMLSSIKKGVIVVGEMNSSHSLHSIIELAEKLQWPLLPDILCGLRLDRPTSASISYYDFVLENSPDLQVDCVLHLGDRIVSKTIFQWLSMAPPSCYILVANHPLRYDPTHLVTHRLNMDPSLFCQNLLPFTAASSPSDLPKWKERSVNIQQKIASLEENFSLAEPGLIRYLHHHLPSTYALFLANSMPIRDANHFFFPSSFHGPIFGKRGLSGIDGNIAAAIGLAEGTQRPVVAILGDLTALHDINSLAAVHKTAYPIIFLIVNNQGGGIFSFLPIVERKEVFEEFFAAAHPFTLSHAAHLFHLPYLDLQNFNQIKEVLEKPKSCILELKTNREENRLLHASIQKEIRLLTSLTSLGK